MKALSAFGLAVLLSVACGARAADDDNAKKIIGVWVVEKAEEIPAGATVEFTKDGKLLLVAKINDKELKLEGTYKVEKDKLMTKMKIGDKVTEDTDTITKLTDEALELTDKDKKTATFKKKK